MELIVASHLALENWAFLGYLNFSKILKKCWLVYQMKLWRPLIIPHYRPHRHGSCGGEARIGTDWIYSISTHTKIRDDDLKVLISLRRVKPFVVPYLPISSSFLSPSGKEQYVRLASCVITTLVFNTLEDIYKTMKDSKSQLKTMPQRASFSA